MCLQLLPERTEFQLLRISRVGGRTGLLASYSLETLNSTPKPVEGFLGEDGEGGSYLQREKELVGLEEWGHGAEERAGSSTALESLSSRVSSSHRGHRRLASGSAI